MPEKIGRIRVSLATKCQLLFGVALLLIIGAALWVPWQRMEELMRQIDRRAAQTLADHHLALHTAFHDGKATSESLPATTQPLKLGDKWIRPPKVLGVPASKAERAEKLTVFERRALDTFINQADAEFFERHYTRRDGAELGYRLALPLWARGDCLRCHTVDDANQRVNELLGINSAAKSESVANTPTLMGEVLDDRPEPQKSVPLLGMVVVDINSQVEQSQQWLNRVSFLVAGLAAGALAVVVFSGITSKFILRPVRVLQEAAEKVSSGDMNIRSDISSGDEFQQLSETFNTMLGNLKQSTEQLKAINLSLDVRLEQLSQTNVALYESNRMKSEFVANVSHELRTPLNSILGFAELLRETGGNPNTERNARYLSNILTSGRTLLELIEGLLDLAKIEAGRMEVSSEPIVMADMAEGMELMLKPLLEKKQLTLDAKVQSDVPIVRTDKGKLRQIFYNLLSNAIKFSPTGGKIELRVFRPGAGNVYPAGMPDAAVGTGMIRVEITDQGPGIEQEKQKLIFEKFRQLDGSVTREHGGTGLGLAISKELVGLLEGRIGVRSTAGEGACFWFEIPESPLHA